MKKRNIMMFSVIALAIALVAGGTMAWFTSTPEAIDNVFAAGTVEIEVNENGFEDLTNVNPGDTHEKEVTIISNGSKQTYVRVSLTPEWIGADELELPLLNDNIAVASFEIGDDWIDGGDGYYYYKFILDDEDNETTPLITEVVFNGPAMNNDYQGATFTLTVSADAVQASNYAFRDVWSIAAPAVVPVTGVEEWIASTPL